MKLPNGLTPQEIRVLQEFRRVEKDELTEDEIKTINHPSGGGIEPARALVQKGFLTGAAEGAGFRVTDRARALLAVNPVPATAEPEASGAGA